MLNLLWDYNRDIFIARLCCYFSDTDCFVTATLSKCFLELLDHEQVWKEFAAERIPVIVSNRRNSSDELLFLWKSSFMFPTHRHLFYCLRNVRYSPINCLFRLLPYDLNTCAGGIIQLKISDTDPVIMLSRWLPSSRQFSNIQCIVRYSVHYGSVVVQLDEILFKLRFDADTVTMIAIGYESLDRVFSTIPIKKTIDSDAHGALGNNLDSCLGFYTATYGSHGQEILHISMHSKNISCRAVQDTDLLSFGDLQLHGLKITGDPNVPAGQISFCINLNSPRDIDAEIAAYPRLLIFFDEDNQVTVSNMASWRGSIRMWFTGFGQINYHPGTWDPQWARCIFLALNTTQDNSSFLLVWLHDSEIYDHAMLFTSLTIQ